MKRAQLVLVALGIAILGIVLTQPVKATIQTQQAQIVVNVVVQVVGTPIGYVPHQAPAQGGLTIASALRRAVPSVQRAFNAEGLHFEGDSSTLVAQAQVQHSVLVQAEVTPNPKGTILVTNVPNVTVTAAPGQTVRVTPACSLTVTVNMTTAWSLEEGVTSDFASGFPGKDLANDTYKNSATPLPTSTPYIVYADDGSVWSGLGSGTAITTYCVDLTVTVPLTVTDGTYVTNAVYTLFN
ncbi:MAG: hypothetical protein WBA06_06640 [Candidatus Aquilonibacter sp.]|jgi:hypothetical protein